MKRILIFVLLIVMVGASIIFGAVNFKETLLTPTVGVSKPDDSTRTQLVAAKQWFDITKVRAPDGSMPAMVRVISFLKTGDTDCDSVTYLWLTTPDTAATIAYVTRDSTEISGNTAGARVLFTANIEDSLYQWNIIAARPQCDDAAVALLSFNTFVYLYDGLGQLYAIRPFKAVHRQAIGGGI